VADAYLKTWHGYGFVGPEFSEERAQKLGEQAAGFGFPDVPMICIDAACLDDPEIFKAMIATPMTIVPMVPSTDETFRYERIAPLAGSCGDGVVGD
jgi:hypothetical protein